MTKLILTLSLALAPFAARASEFERREAAVEAARRQQVEVNTAQERANAAGVVAQKIAVMAASHGGVTSQEGRPDSIGDTVRITQVSFTTGDGLACQLNDRYIRCESDFGVCLSKFKLFATCYDGQNRQLSLAPNGRAIYLQ